MNTEQKIPNENAGKKIFLYSFFSIAIATLTFFFVIQNNFHKMDKIKLQIEQNIKKIEDLEKEHISIQDEISKIETKDQTIKETIAKIIEDIIPNKENSLEFANFFKNYANLFHSDNNPLIINEIIYYPEINNTDYMILPLTMKFQTSRANLENILDIFLRSGSLKKNDFFQNKPIRLMNINKLKINLNENQEYLLEANLEVFYSSS